MSAGDARPLRALLERGEGQGSEQRFLFVGGKGGVGKTSSSAALAVRLSDAGFRTLLVSTDPAHSLGDALMQDVSGGSPVDVVGCANLAAMEVETGDAVARFRKAVGGFRAADLGLGGVAEDVVAKLGLDEFADILDNTPPGLDELLALAETLEFVRGGKAAEGYERVVFDTAPTGHTLRLLAFPEFLDNLLGKLVALRGRLGGVLALIRGFTASDPGAKVDAAVERLEGWQRRVAELEGLLTDPDTTDFVVIGIPSRLAVAESARLLSALSEQDIPVNHLVVNQVLGAAEAGAYVERIAAEQQRSLKAIDSGASALADLKLTRVPFFAMELRGVPALQFYAGNLLGGAGPAAEPAAEPWKDLVEDARDRFILVGGKGGVGKTTTASALAVGFAQAGLNTLIVSTDPAHSLGDSLEVDLSAGEVVRVEGLAGASLYAIEVKVDEAVADFKALIGGLADGGGGSDQGIGIADFADVFDAVPPGVDELVALSKIVALSRADSYGVHFDRVVVDTAPTGHTLRLLTFPTFLDRFIDRVISLRRRVQSAADLVGDASAFLGNVLGGAGKSTLLQEDRPRALAALEGFQAQMRDLQALLKDAATTEFVIVAIPTALALSEAERLLLALREQNIAVRRGVLNRLIAPSDADAYLAQMGKGQQVHLAKLRDLAGRADVSVTEVPFFDTEPRAVYGLRALGAALFDAPPR